MAADEADYGEKPVFLTHQFLPGGQSWSCWYRAALEDSRKQFYSAKLMVYLPGNEKAKGEISPS